MADSLTAQIRRTFDLIAKDEGLVLRTGRHWRQYQDLKNRCKDAKAHEVKLYQDHYLTRAAAAHKSLIDKAGSKTRDYKHQWFGEDVFDKTRLMRQAQRQVDQQHKRRLSQIDHYEIRQTEQLLARTRQENRVHGRAEFDFNTVADQRQTAERRDASATENSSERSEPNSDSSEQSQSAKPSQKPTHTSKRVTRPQPRSRRRS